MTVLEDLNRVNVLYDIYAPLLTKRRQEVLHYYFSENYSLAEIAIKYDVSRQAVHDLIRRSLESIESFDAKLGLYNQYCLRQSLLDEAELIVGGDDLAEGSLHRLREIIGDLRRSDDQ